MQNKLEQEGIGINYIYIEGYSESIVQTIEISLNSFDSGDNVLYKIKQEFDDIENDLDITIGKRTVEI